MASAIPVLPLVGSRMMVSGRSSPACSAASIIATPMRSFTLLAGLKNSSLATTCAVAPSVTRRSRTSGVFPISSVTSAAIRIACPFHRFVTHRAMWLCALPVSPAATRRLGRLRQPVLG